MSTQISALAHYLPAATEVVGVSRPIFVEPGGPSDLALEPSRKALSARGSSEADVDFIIFATMTPDVTFPGSACFLQDKLKCRTVGALDIRGQCTGFLMGLMIADAFLESGTYQRILLASAEVHSSGLDYSERGAKISRLYGDGAAVTLLESGTGSRGLRSVVTHSDGRRHDRFWCEFPGSRQHPTRITVENFRAGRHFPEIDFDAVRDFGRTQLPGVVDEALAKASVKREEIDVYILSHILPEVVADSAEALAIPAEKLIDAGAPHGHLTAATLPVALSEALESGRVGKGARVCLATCGAGFTWGAAVLEL